VVQAGRRLARVHGDRQGRHGDGQALQRRVRVHRVSDPLAAALAAAREAGFPTDDPEVIAGAANVFVHLRPAPVLARVTVALDRGPGALATELAFARAAADRGAPV